jgi:hypothetical protein
VQRSDRLIILAIFLVIAVWRLIRYFRAATERRAQPAIPGSGGIAPPPPAAVAAPGTPVAPPGSALGTVTTVLVWLLANAALWPLLFAWPPLADLPVIWRLVAGIFANFYLVKLARAAGARVSRRSAQEQTAADLPPP